MKLPTVFASAGAMTTAKSTGVSRGTKSSLGVRAESENRRRDSVASGANQLVEAVERPTRDLGAGGAVVTADMVVPPSGSGGQAAARRLPVRLRYTSSSVGVLVAIPATDRPRSAMMAITLDADASCTGTVTVEPTLNASSPARPRARSSASALEGSF